MTTPSRGELALRESTALGSDIDPAHLSGAMLKFIANTDFVPKAFRGNTPAIAACVATGRALGLPDMTALRSIHIIDGKASFSAELMVMLVRGKGHSITGTVSAEAASVTGKRVDNDDSMTVEFTLEDAKRAELTSKGNWKKYPDAMLWARAVSQLCRMLFADCFAGATYTPEELGAGDFTADELMDEPASGVAGDVVDAGSAAEPVAPEDEEAGEIVAETDEPVDEPADVTQQQRDDLLELVARLSEKRSDVNWSKQLTEKLAKDFQAKSYNDLSAGQMDEVLDWLEGEVPQRKRATA